MEEENKENETDQNGDGDVDPVRSRRVNADSHSKNMREEFQNSEDLEASNGVEMIPDEETSGPEAGAKIKKLREELKKREAEKKEYLDGWQRARADLINYKKDEARHFEEFAKFAAENLIAELLQVLDGLDLALEHEMPKEVGRGIIMIRSQLEDVLKRHGLEAIKTEGQKFNPSFHESMGETESDGDEGAVAEELQKGYLLNGRVLRPARVKILKSKQSKQNNN